MRCWTSSKCVGILTNRASTASDRWFRTTRISKDSRPYVPFHICETVGKQNPSPANCTSRSSTRLSRRQHSDYRDLERHSKAARYARVCRYVKYTKNVLADEANAAIESDIHSAQSGTTAVIETNRDERPSHTSFNLPNIRGADKGARHGESTYVSLKPTQKGH